LLRFPEALKVISSKDSYNLIIMKKIFLFAIAVLTLNSCQHDDQAAVSSFEMQPAGADYAAASLLPVTTVSGSITANTTWANTSVWEIDGVVRVTGGTLTINPGTFIKAKPGTAGVLIICKGAKINAVGTGTGTCAPIIFTSYKLLDNNAATKALPGDFGGLIVLGDAPVNTGVTTNLIEGLTDQSNLSDFYYGGSNSAHNGGTLKYVRIEFAGRKIGAADAGNEVNGLTLGGVGSATVIDHIQVSYGQDDSFEFFGGTVDASYLVSFACDDDNFDFDLGYTGTIDRAIAIANKNSTHSFSGSAVDSNGIELDNDAAGSGNLPITRPLVNHMSIYGVSACADGSLYENGIHVRRNGDLILRNSTVSGYSTGVRAEAGSVITSVNDKIHAFVNATFDTGTFGSGFTSTVACGTADSFGLTTPFYVPGSCVLNFTSTSTTAGAFADSVGDWTSCWTKFCDFQTIYE
jgi:hypothetical protein